MRLRAGVLAPAASGDAPVLMRREPLEPGDAPQPCNCPCRPGLAMKGFPDCAGAPPNPAVIVNSVNLAQQVIGVKVRETPRDLGIVEVERLDQMGGRNRRQPPHRGAASGTCAVENERELARLRAAAG
jgi:hypothetical protein